MKKFFSLVLALVMALSLTTVAWGAVTYTVDPTNGTDSGTSWKTIEGALGVASNGDTIKLLDDVTLTAQIVFDKTVTIVSDAAVTVNTGAIAEAFKVTAGTLTLGEAVTLSGSNAIIEIYGGECVIDGATVTSSSSANCAIGVDVAGATLTVKSGTVSSTGDHGSAIGMVDGTVNIQGGNIFVTSNSDRATVFNHGGTINVTGGTITNEGTGTALLASSAYGGTAVVNVSGGYVDKVATHETNGGSVAVSGGAFGVVPKAEYIEDGYQLLANGSVVATPAAGATDPVLYVADNSAAGWATYYIATGADLDDLKQGADENCLPCYLIDGEYFVEVNAAAGAYKLVYGATTVYLKAVPSTAVCYSAKASALKVVDADDAVCGDYYVTALDEDDVYYASYNKKGVVTGIYKAAKTGFNVLVNGKLVVVEDVTAVVEQLKHDWKGYDVVNYEYTTVKCANCGKVAPLFANSSAAGKDAFKVVVNGDTLGWITKVANDFTVAGTPSTDKTVTSADTFDAGIAMYVGMSVMAAAGSAVVIGKKKD